MENVRLQFPDNTIETHPMVRTPALGEDIQLRETIFEVTAVRHYLDGEHRGTLRVRLEKVATPTAMPPAGG